MYIEVGWYLPLKMRTVHEPMSNVLHIEPTIRHGYNRNESILRNRVRWYVKLENNSYMRLSQQGL